MAVRRTYDEQQNPELMGYGVDTPSGNPYDSIPENPMTGLSAPEPQPAIMGMNAGDPNFVQPKKQPHLPGTGNAPNFPSAGSETPRERADVSLRGLGSGGNATPPRPSAPTPMAGSVQSIPPGGGPGGGLQPFQPLPSTDLAGLANPRRAGLLGASGGLLGGGLGVAGNNPAAAPGISALIKRLLGGQ